MKCIHGVDSGTYDIEVRHMNCYACEEEEKELSSLRAELASAKTDYERACETIAKMHEAAVGGVTGPKLGVVEDVAALRFRITELEQQVSNLEKYMLEGVAFRDELQARIEELEKILEKTREAAKEYLGTIDHDQRSKLVSQTFYWQKLDALRSALAEESK